MPQDETQSGAGNFSAQSMLAAARARLERNDVQGALKAVDEMLMAGHCPPGSYYLRACCFERLNWPTQTMQAARAEEIINPGYPGAVELYRQAEAKVLPRGSELPSERPWSTALDQARILQLEHCSHRNTYRGVPMIKNVFDLALYPMLLWDVKPRTIIEIGSCYGGSALWMADMTWAWGLDTRVYSVDIIKVRTASHDRVTFIEGDGRNLASVFSDAFLAGLPRPWLVIEDADHSYATTSAVLNFFHNRLQSGEYIIVEDVITTPTETGRALHEFLQQHSSEYLVDRHYCDFFGMNVTWCVNGFLRRTGAGGATGR